MMNPVEIDAPAKNATLVRRLGLLDSTALVVGVMIGSGIFLVPGAIARDLTSLTGVIAVWIVGGILSVFGGLALAELGASLPRAGGLYVYIERAYGPFLGFIYGWMGLCIINSGSVATMAAGVGSYIAPIAHFSFWQQKLFQVGVLAFFTAINCIGVTPAKWVQNALSITKMSGLVLMIVFLLAHGSSTRLVDNLWSPSSQIHLAPFGIALIAVLWAYDGWHTISFAAGEVENPTRNIPRSLVLGTVACLLVYVLANIAYYSVLDPAAIRASDRVAAMAVLTAMGKKAATVLTILIAISILGAVNGSTLATPRATMAMAEDGLFFRFLGKVHPKYHTPVPALIAHWIWAAALTVLGTFQELFTAVIFTAWIFYGLSVFAVIVLRHKEPGRQLPYRCPLFPLPPLLFVAVTLWIVVNTIVMDFRHSLWGLVPIALGVPLYYLFRILNRQRSEDLSLLPD